MTDNVWDCEYFSRCKNTSRCMLCGPSQHLLELPEDKARKAYRAKANDNVTTALEDNSGATLESYVRDQLNNVPTRREYESRRQAGSGNIWFMPGDVVDSVILAECKERHQLTTSGGKQITITKLMLDKIREESKILQRYPALPFRFKGDDRTYIINEFEVLVEMIHEIKVLRYDNEQLIKERDTWKKAAKKLETELKRERKRNQHEESEIEWQ